MAEIKSTLTFDKVVIQKIIGHSIEKVEGLLSVDGGFLSNIKDKIVNSNDVTTGVNVEVGKEEVATDLDIIVEYGKDIPKIADKIKSVISQNVAEMTHLKVIEVNIKVVDVMSKEEYESASVSLQDRVEDGYNRAKEVTVAGFEKTKEVAQSAGEFVSDKASDAKDYISDKASDAKDYISDKASDVKEVAQDAGQKISEKASDAKDYISDKASDVKDSISKDSKVTVK